MSAHKISLPAAILINLNIIVGSGIFINTVLLARLAGQYGALTYLMVGLGILPILLSFSRLAWQHRGGSLYTYAAMQGPRIALLSTWSYFLAKLASCAVAVHVCTSLLQTLFPILQAMSLLVFDSVVIFVFTLLNTLSGRAGKRIQIIFLTGKMLPIVTVLLLGIISLVASLSLPAITATASPIIPWSGVISGIPFVLYAFMGFEATSGLSRSLKNPERDGAWAISIAYILGLIITTSFQFFFTYLVPSLGALTTYLDAFPVLLSTLGLSGVATDSLIIILQSGIAVSAAGVAFGIIYVNSWNFYELVERGHVRYASAWLHKLYHHVPLCCVVIEGVIVWLFLFFTQGHITTLQQISAFGVVVTYLVSTLSLFLSESGMRRLVPLFGMASCALLLGSCVRNFIVGGPLPLMIFVMLMASSMILFSDTPKPMHEKPIVP